MTEDRVRFSGDSGGSAINKLFSIISSNVMHPPLTGYTRLGIIIEIIRYNLQIK